MRVLLDTSAYSLFKRGHPAAVEAVATATLVGFTAVVLGELLSGFRSGGREVRNRQELREFLASPRVQVLPMGLETGERFAAIHQLLRQTGKPLPPNDMWIAASAMEHGLRVLTADTHFRAIPTLLAEYLAVE